MGVVGIITLLAGLAWDAVAHAADPHLGGHEGVFTLANPAHVALLSGVGLVAIGVTGAVDASLRAPSSHWSPTRRRGVLAAVAVPVSSSLAVLTWAMTRPPPPSIAEIPPVAEVAGNDDHHGSEPGDLSDLTARERIEAEALVTATKLALANAGYQDVAVAEAAGYRPVQPPTSQLVHYVKLTNLADPTVLDPAAPESLVYRSTADGPVLQGAMYILPSADSPIPSLGGLASHWHGHDDLCFSATTAMVVGTLGPDGSCPPGAVNQVTPPMLHVWTVDHPGGPFAGL